MSTRTHTQPTYSEWLALGNTGSTDDYAREMNSKVSAEAAADRTKRERISKEQEESVPQR